MISFIIPAYNEESVLGATLDTLFASARTAGEPFEVIVVDDASEDRTAEIARERGARVVSVKRRQIAAARNAGAREAKGDILIFVDADTLLPARTLGAALAALRSGAVGGGAGFKFDGGVAPLMRFSVGALLLFMRLCRWAAGCFIFARRDAFEAAGGFDERYFASEELHLSRALKRQGKFRILREEVITSGRKARMHSPAQVLAVVLRLLFRFLLRGPKGLQRREGLEVWYDGRLRERGYHK